MARHEWSPNLCKEPKKAFHPSVIPAAKADPSSFWLFSLIISATLHLKSICLYSVLNPDDWHKFFGPKDAVTGGQVPKEEDKSHMGSLRNMPRETPIEPKRQTRALTRMDTEPYLRSAELCFKHNFLIDVIEELEREGPGPLITHANMRKDKTLTSLECYVRAETLRKWYYDFVEDGSICGDRGIFWLPEQKPPKDEIITVFSHLPTEETEAATVKSLARQTGLWVVRVESAIQEILDKDWAYETTPHRTPRYYKFDL